MDFTFAEFFNIPKSSTQYEVFTGPHIRVFDLNVEIYIRNLCGQSKQGKIRTRKTAHSDISQVVLNNYLAEQLSLDSFFSLV